MAEATGLAKLMEAERAKLDAAEEDALNQIRTIQEKLADIRRQREAIDAYERALSGKQAKTTTSTRNSGIRTELKNLITSSPAGIKRADIMKAMSATNDKKKQVSISAALQALKAANVVTSEGGVYRPV